MEDENYVVPTGENSENTSSVANTPVKQAPPSASKRASVSTPTQATPRQQQQQQQQQQSTPNLPRSSSKPGSAASNRVASARSSARTMPPVLATQQRAIARAICNGSTHEGCIHSYVKSNNFSFQPEISPELKKRGLCNALQSALVCLVILDSFSCVIPQANVA